MNFSSVIDENLSQDILDEDVIAPRRINSLHSEDKISCSPFQRKNDHFRKATSCSVHKNSSNADRQALEICKKKAMGVKKFSSQNQCNFKSLQKDIRYLLHQAMKIRNLYDAEFERRIEPKYNDPPQQLLIKSEIRVVTMADIQKPE
ncbi:unnamed protein product [Moneuplotes crassus]|uniref:Uncharacterized protein n=1 Tax=Euplotes crassus TaxID=5936 RepID=A0AAD1XF52_EUPCR|nr:unnamed protein product [Moneuplotes crassus]